MVTQSHTLLLEEMHKFHVHFIDKLATHSELIETVSIDLLTFWADIERDLTSFHNRFLSMEANIQEIINILKMRDEANEFEMMAREVPPSPPL